MVDALEIPSQPTVGRGGIYLKDEL